MRARILLALYGRLEGPWTGNGRVLPLQQIRACQGVREYEESRFRASNCKACAREVHALFSAVHESSAFAQIRGPNPQRNRRENGALACRERLQNYGSYLFEKRGRASYRM